MQLKIRCSSLNDIIGQRKDSLTLSQVEQLFELGFKGDNRTAKQETEYKKLCKKYYNRPEFDLTEGAKTAVKKLVKKQRYGYTDTLSTKQMQKGIECEQDSIDLLNELYFTDYEKNETRISNDYLTGECDIIDREQSLIIDIKSSWSLETFPLIPEDIKLNGYDIQGHGYMLLYDVQEFVLSFCLVDTPDHLLNEYDNLDVHLVEIEIPIEERETRLRFKRSKYMDELIEYKCKEAQRYAAWYSQQIDNKRLSQ